MPKHKKRGTPKQKFFPSIYPEDRPTVIKVAIENKIKNPPPLKANTPNQKVYLKKLKQGHHDILFAVGPAGTGKTYMAVRQAIKDFQNGEIAKIVITRPNVATGDDLGYLPGTLTEKMAPWTRPIIDVFNECYSTFEVQRMLAAEEIEIAPLAYMRGRTFKNCVVIADEMQNATAEQMKMLMTRIGEHCRMIITGDMEQYDRRELRTESGLTDITRRLAVRAEQAAAEAPLPSFITGEHETVLPADPAKRWERIGLVNLLKEDVVRHPVIQEVLELYAA